MLQFCAIISIFGTTNRNKPNRLINIYLELTLCCLILWFPSNNSEWIIYIFWYLSFISCLSILCLDSQAILVFVQERKRVLLLILISCQHHRLIMKMVLLCLPTFINSKNNFYCSLHLFSFVYSVVKANFITSTLFSWHVVNREKTDKIEGK